MKYRMKSYLLFAGIILVLVSGCSLKKNAQSDDFRGITPQLNGKTSDMIAASANNARDLVLDYFIPLEGLIEEIEDGLVKVRLREDGHVKKGMRFSVFREGGPFYHPVTNELIGNAEDFVGRIEVENEDDVDGMYVCTMISGVIKVGDKIRISSSRIKLAFFQDRKANWSVSEAFYGSLKDAGRFEIAESYSPDYKADTVSKLARDLGAEAALIFSTPVKDGKRLLNIKLYWAEDAGLLGEIEEETGQSIEDMASSDEEFISSTFRETKPWRRFKLPGGRLIAMGDVDGNGTDDFAVSDGRDIRIYSIKDEFRELWIIKGKGEGSHLSLDVLDVNSNGIAEIFVTSVVNAGRIHTGESEIYEDDIKVNSFVIEFDPTKGYKRIKENISYFLRVSGKTLLMQRFNNVEIFSGPVYKGKWKEKHYVPDKPLQLPDEANIYGFTYVDWRNDGRVDLMTYDNDGYLSLYDDNGNIKWRSDKSYGPYTFSFESSTRSIANPRVNWSIRGRLESVRTERGQEVIAVNRKPVLSGVPGLGVNEADVYSLWWDGSVMDKKPVLSEVPGAVTDYLIQGRELFLVARGDFYTLLGNITEGEFSNSSILYYYIFAPSENNP